MTPIFRKRIVEDMKRKKSYKINKKGRRGQKGVNDDPFGIIETMTQAGRPLFLREILHLAHISPHERNRAKKLIKQYVNQGKLVLIKGNRYGLAKMMRLVTGTLSVHPDGFGFVKPLPDQPEKEDIFIPPRRLKTALHGDKVVVRIEGARGRRLEGSILRVLERGVKKVVGTFHRRKAVSVVVPEDERLGFEIVIPRGQQKRAKNGQVVVAEIDFFPEGSRNPEGKITEVLGDPEDISVQTKIVINKYELRHKFPPAVRKHAAKIPSRVVQADFRGRKDIRNLPLVTIDGEDAKDFDDAVFVKKTRSGYVLTVAIADVGHYVEKASPIDKEAKERGTSVYFPGSVVPMLPEKLSNNLCSLVPQKDRLAVVARICFDLQANVTRRTFFKAVIKSHKRFTYTQVRRILVDKDKRLIAENNEMVGHLECMAELALLLHEKRRLRGSIDFDLPEPYFVLGMRGELEEIVRRERNLAHQIIEEFMIAANEAVAHNLNHRDIPTLYRVHEEPDRERLEDFVKFARGVGLDIEIPEELTPRWCQEVLERVSDTPYEYVINHLLLRSMKQAVYSPENIGHFGLASPTYLHFTSPIRRYPDLVVHRILKGNLRKKRKRPVYDMEELQQLGSESSARERNAMEAEREVLDRLKVRFMADKVGQVFEGVISAVTSFGFFVELKDMFVEGAVRLVDLVDDYYEADLTSQRLVGRRSGRVYQLGQQVKVMVRDVNIARRHINFEIVE